MLLEARFTVQEGKALACSIYWPQTSVTVQSKTRLADDMGSIYRNLFRLPELQCAPVQEGHLPHGPPCIGALVPCVLHVVVYMQIHMPNHVLYLQFVSWWSRQIIFLKDVYVYT